MINLISDAIAAVRECVEALGQNVVITSSLAVDAGKWKVYAKYPRFLRVNNTVESGENSYTVTAIECNYIEITGSVAPGDTFNTAPVYFMHGTIKTVQNDMLGLDNMGEQFTPLVFFIEAATGDFDSTPSAAMDFTNSTRLLILKDCSNADWLNADHYTNVVEVTEDIFKELVVLLNRSKKVVPYVKGRVSNYVNVGSYSDKGSEKNMFVFYFSGTDVRFNLPLRQNNCNCPN